MTEKKSHSSIGGSSIYRLSQCPGSRALSEIVPAQESSEHADRGTAAHKWAEELLALEYPSTACQLAIVAKSLNGANNWETDEIGSIHTYVKYVKSLKGQLLVEHKFDLSYLHPDAFGTADAVVWDKNTKTLHIIDYKHGAGVYVEAEGNKQAQFYALGAAQEFKADKIIVTIVQPRCTRVEDTEENDEISKGIRSWEIDPLHLFDFEQELKEIYEKAFEPEAPLIPGSHCRFCPAHQVDSNGDFLCSALKKNQEVALVEAFKNTDLDINPEQLSEYLSMCTQVETWIKLLRAKALHKLNSGEEVPGWKLVAKRATRKWVLYAEKELAEIFTEPHLKGIDIYEPAKLKSPAQLEKALNKKQKTLITEFIKSESSGVTLAPTKDKRPAVASGNNFAALEMDEE